MPSRRPSGLLRRVVHPVFRKLETAVHPLRYLFLEVTQRCNLRCRHCGSDCGREARAGELSTDEWLRFLAYLPERFDRRQLVLVVTGGEPLARPEFGRLTRAMRERGLAWGLVTNGWALTDRNVERLVADGVSSVTVSLDGMRESHDWLRGVPGSYDRALAGIRRLAAAGLPFFDVVTCANPRNLPELPQVLETLRDAGVRDWRLFSIFPLGRAKGDPELLLADDGFRGLLDFIRSERARLRGDAFRLRFSCEAYLPRDLDAAVRDEPYFCRAGIDIASVLCDGSIGGCPNVPRTLVQGNVRTDDFATVWNDRFLPYRDRSWMRTGPCVSCREWKRCLGNSLHLWDDAAKRTAYCSFDRVRR